MTDAAGPVLSQSQIAEAIGLFTPAQWARLERVAAKYAWRAGWQTDDLVNEALTRAAAGDRRCPMNVDPVRFLAEAMRSIADDEANKLPNYTPHVPIRRGVGGGDHGVDLADPTLGADQCLIAEEEAAAIREEIMVLFKEDKLAVDILEGIMAEYSASDMCELLEIDVKTYNSKRRKIRRTLDNVFPQRRQR